MQSVDQILKKVRKLEIKTHLWVEGLISGEYRSVFKGRGIEFSEVREYMPFDDIRAIDWNVTARFNTPFVKEFIEERDLNIYIVFDLSASNDFGFEKSKKEVGFEIAASLVFAALRNNDNVGLFLFTDKVEKFIPAKKGRKNSLKLLRELVLYKPKSQKTDIEAALWFVSKVVKKRSIIFIISDCISGSFDKPLKVLKNRHDVILVHLYDPVELDIPDIGFALIEDEETGEQLLINTSDEEFRQAYCQKFKSEWNEMSRRMRSLGVGFIPVNTKEPFYVPLMRFFKIREKRS